MLHLYHHKASTATSISFCIDAKELTSALSALEELTLKLNVSSGDAVEQVLFIPTLKKLDLTLVSDHVL